MSKFTCMAFEENGCGSITNIVGRKTLFKNKEEFVRYCINDCDELKDDEWSILKSELREDDVLEGYVRYYPKMPEDRCIEIDSGWTFCNKSNGALPVYYIETD